MSKQLLHVHQSNVVVAALAERAYAVLVVRDDDGDASGAASSSAAEAWELLPAHHQGEATTDDNDRDAPETKNCIVDAVCATEVDSTLWLAASREDKTLCLYSVPTHSGEEKSTEEETKQRVLRPAAVYRVPKRAKCLAFASVPSSSSSGNACDVIIAGDAAGDAHAFPVPAASSSDQQPSNGGPPNGASRRLLLGHTASILTGLVVAPAAASSDEPEQRQYVLTADRDGKVRISHFPDTHRIHGYLLGNTSYVSAMDAAVAPGADGDKGTRALCVTGTGDGRVVLWDYDTCKQVGMVPVVLRAQEVDGPSEEEDRKVCAEDDANEEKNGTGEEENGAGENAGEDGVEDVDDFDDDDDDDNHVVDGHAIATPLAVSLDPHAAHLAVAREGIASVDVHPIPPPAPKSSTSTSLSLSHLVSLHAKQTLDCPSQPLAVKCLADGSILVLAREPDYILYYRRTDAGGYEDVSSSSPFCTALRAAAKEANIVMPASNLETYAGGGGPRKLRTKANTDGEDEAEGDAKRTGLHWNDAERKEMARKAEQRRRKRRRDEASRKE